MSTILNVKDLKKTYSSGVQALKGVSLDIPAGMFGLLGPNGAGKTTLMKILATLLEADSGTAQMNGLDLIANKADTRRVLGYLPQDFGLYPTLTAAQMLDYFAKLKGVNNKKERRALVDALLEKVNLYEERNRRLGGFSGGMRQRVGIAQALIGNPKLLIVDEPTSGLDPEERTRLHNVLAESAGEDTVVLLSTHIVSDVSNLCDRFAVIRRGEIVAATSTGAALNELEGRIWEATMPREQIAGLEANGKVISKQMAGGNLRVRVLSENGKPSDSFTRVTATLEDYYFTVVNQT
ncbi:MAG TPA: ABC transporter ATP-binding protein [Pyrinomonadaceae bacterium]|jgi:ABC-type multidrug transport system ATPase subunit|nr:ABC transporter ATP-binding protein [Pyrinomonadaceae bacterium]